MAENWEPGDLALCVRGGFIDGPGRTGYPVRGKLYTVSHVGVATFPSGRLAALWLKDGPLNTNGEPVWPAFRFIKVTPPKEMIDAERREEVPA